MKRRTRRQLRPKRQPADLFTLPSACNMVLATINKPKNLLHLSYIGEVRAEELAQTREEVGVLLADLTPGFRLLTDLGRLDSMSSDCATEIGKIMQLCGQKGVKLVVRVIPDSTKDIGLNILSLFHYPRRPRIVSCENMVEAAKLLSLQRAEKPNTTT